LSAVGRVGPLLAEEEGAPACFQEKKGGRRHMTSLRGGRRKKRRYSCLKAYVDPDLKRGEKKRGISHFLKTPEKGKRGGNRARKIISSSRILR